MTTNLQKRSYGVSWALCIMAPVIIALRFYNGGYTMTAESIGNAAEMVGFYAAVFGVGFRNIWEVKRERKLNATP
jgi:hypothetical protein